MDTLIVGALELLPEYLVTGRIAVGTDVETSTGGAWFILLGSLAAVAYLVAGNARGATLGKRIVDLRIVNEDGHPPGYRKSALRYLVSIVSGFVFALGYLRMLWHPRKQTLHDRAAGTYVVRRPTPTPEIRPLQ